MRVILVRYVFKKSILLPFIGQTVFFLLENNVNFYLPYRQKTG